MQQHDNPPSQPAPAPAAWAVMTGRLHDKPELRENIEFLGSLKRAGLLAEFILSTSSGEPAKFPELAGLVTAQGGLILENDAPSLVSKASYTELIAQLDNALELCPDGVFVLKLHTVACGPSSGFVPAEIQACLAAADFARPIQEAGNVLHYRIGLLGDHTRADFPMIFFWNDRAYLAFKQDMQRLCNAFSPLLLDRFALLPEQALFSSIFLPRFRAIAEFFKAVNQTEIVSRRDDIRGDPARERALSDFITGLALFRDAMLAERYVQSRYFFNVRTGENFLFNTLYQGQDLSDRGELTQLVSGHAPGYSPERASLTNYLQEQFGLRSTRPLPLSRGKQGFHCEAGVNTMQVRGPAS